MKLPPDQLTWYEVAKRRVEDENPGDEEHHIAGRTPQTVEDENHKNRTDGDTKVGIATKSAIIAQPQKVYRDIEERHDGNKGEHNVIPGNPGIFLAVKPDRQEDNRQRKPHDEGVVLLVHEGEAEILEEINIPKQSHKRHEGGEATPYQSHPGLH